MSAWDDFKRGITPDWEFVGSLVGWMVVVFLLAGTAIGAAFIAKRVFG